jgi:hypothetical protein
VIQGILKSGVTRARTSKVGSTQPRRLRGRTPARLLDLDRHCRKFDAADVCYEEAAALYRNHDTPWSLDYANAIRPMAILKERLGDREQSLALWREARGLYAAIRPYVPTIAMDTATHAAAAIVIQTPDRAISRIEK